MAGAVNRARPPSFSDLEDLTGVVKKASQHAVGTGGYADIWIGSGVIKGTEQTVAVKVLRSFTDTSCGHMKKLDKRLRREVSVWKTLEHKNVLPLLGIVRDFGPYVSMVCPWMEKGSLTQYMERRGASLSTPKRLQIIREVASGLAYLHSKDVVHGDLTGSNILLDDTDRVYIGDFGFATIVAQFRGTSLDSSTVSGAIRWMAPECVFDNDKSLLSDVYSFSSIMYQVFTARLPYHGTKEAHIILQLKDRHHPERPHSPAISDSYWELMLHCWRKAPSKRPSMDNIRVRLRILRKSSKYYSINIPSSSSSITERSLLWSPLPLRSSPNTSPASNFLKLSEPSAVIESPSPHYPLSSQNILRSRHTSSPPRISDPSSAPYRVQKSPRRPKSPITKVKPSHPLRHAVTWPSPQPQSSSPLRTLTMIPPQHCAFKYATCVRCGHTFKKYPGDSDDGDIILIYQSICCYHSGEIVEPDTPYTEGMWSCCSRDLKQPGCCNAPQHYSED